MNKKLSKLQAYNAIITFLDRYYDEHKSDNLSDFITYAYFWFDRKTADPAAWSEWQDSLKIAVQQDKSLRNFNRLTSIQACNAMVIFFKLYCSLYVELPSDMSIVLKMLESLQDNRRSNPMWQKWIKAINDIFTKKDPRVYIQIASDIK